jgi:heme o synthase
MLRTLILKSINNNFDLEEKLAGKFRLYWQLIKSLQTGLLLATGITGYISARCPVMNVDTLIELIISLFLTISGSTILNMVYDRDIDSKMKRTCKRPIPSGKVSPREALAVGISISLAGLAIAFSMSFLYGLVVFTGIFIDVVIYTMWLKRKTAWSIIWGGISGGMPILAGRVLGTGEFDLIGLLLSLSILLWIPTHILTFNIKYYDDYTCAGIPVIPSKYGTSKTQLIVALSACGAALSIISGALALGLSWGHIRVLGILSLGILVLAVKCIFRPTEKNNFILFKYASLYMLGSMLVVSLDVLL